MDRRSQKLVEYRRERRGLTTIHEFVYDAPVAGAEEKFESELQRTPSNRTSETDEMMVKLPNQEPFPLSELEYEIDGRTVRAWQFSARRRSFVTLLAESK